MSESDRTAEAAEAAAELTLTSGPGDPGRTTSAKFSKEGRRVSSSSERQFKVERAQKCLENAALVSKRIKEHRRATAELLGKAFEDDETFDASSDLASVSTRTSYSVATSDAGPPISVEDALNIPGISESLANTLKQKEILMEKIKQYKERSKRERPATKSSLTVTSARLPVNPEEDSAQVKRTTDNPAQLQNTVKEETAISIMQVKMRAMETTILDLQEKISEKDSLIEAKTRATTLMSDNLSKKEKDSVNLLEDTRQQMIKMQENFVAMETEWKEEKKRLLSEIELKNEKICHLEEANAILENARFEISLAHSKLVEEINSKTQLITDLELKLKNVPEHTYHEKETAEEEKGSQEISNMIEMTKRLELLEQLNCQIRQTNLELENKLANLNPQVKSSEPTSSKKASPLVTRKRGKSATRNTSSKQKSPWTSLAESSQQESVDKNQSKADSAKDFNVNLESIIQSLNKEILDKEFLISQKESIIESQLEIISQNEIKLCDKPETVDIGLNCNLDYTVPEDILAKPQPDTVKNVKLNEGESLLTTEQLMYQLNIAREQISSLNLELESANKNMVKVKSVQKLKLKQMQKTIDNFSKMSDSNAEVSKLSEEVNQLTQKIAELEEDKGNLQLHLVDYDSGRLSESDSQRKLIELEAMSEARLKAISDLETQKLDLVQELHELQLKNVEIEDKLADLQQLQSEHVCTEMMSLQLEEQLDQAAAAKKELLLVIENLKLDKEHSKQCIKDLQDKNFELSSKLENYIQENMDLADRLEKLSAEKVSSAESIEMVESLTTQEKLELEEYNKKMQFTDQQIPQEKQSGEDEEKAALNESLVNLSQESAELNKKIELFTQERHEVMEKMAELKVENEDLHKKIDEILIQKTDLESQLKLLLEQKDEICKLNIDLSTQIEKLKIEQLEVLRENSNLVKRPSSEEASVESESSSKDVLDNISIENTCQDDKPQALKSKPSKQLTKEILKLKNIIKEREAEIADCQMKILSLEEQNQKQMDMLKYTTLSESTIKALTDDNNLLKEELVTLKLQIENVATVETNEISTLKQSNEALQSAISIAQNEFSTLISMRDIKIKELETLLFEYERKIAVYNDSLQQKDKDITEYLNQITQLNNVSQKLKSTIEVLEEEKQKDHNGELIKNLNIQIINFQKLISEQETKMKILEEEKNKLMLMNNDLSDKNVSLESEINKLYSSLIEKESRVNELQELQTKHDEEVLKQNNQCKERDEEIHEIKLQLRKESIENESLRNALSELETIKNKYIEKIEVIQINRNEDLKKNVELSETCQMLETKNKELMEKLKKFAANLKKKSNMCAELETQISKLHIEIEQKQNEIENLCSKVNECAILRDQVDSLKKELENFNSEGLSFEQNKISELESQLALLLQEKVNLVEQNKCLEANSATAKHDLESLVSNNASLLNELQSHHQQAIELKSNIQKLNNKLSEHEVDQKNSLYLNRKVSELETEVSQKQLQISGLLHELEIIQEEFNTFKFAQDAKIQERDLFIENLESEISNYKARIFRLEETISVMEDRRYTLERKADQLGSQLEEKQKAYSVHSSNEDELVNRLAVLMDHDQVVEKQLKEIEKENSELQKKLQKLLDDNKDLHTNLQSSQEECLIFKNNSNKIHQEELDMANDKITHLESQIKKMSSDFQIMTKKNKEDINTLETEFNLQMEDLIKEKKGLTEKCERVMESNSQLEQEIKQHIESIKVLTSNLEELNKVNAHLHETALKHEETDKSDYTDQYINEINNLQATINKNNADILTLRMQISEQDDTIASLETKLVTLEEDTVRKEKDIHLLTKMLQDSKSEIEMSQTTIDQLKFIISDLDKNLKAKDIEMKDAAKCDVMSSSIILAESEHSIRPFDMDLLKSQIVSEAEQPKSDPRTEKMIRSFEHDSQKGKEQSQGQRTISQGVEDIIVPKKAYLCYDDTPETHVEQSKLYSQTNSDPFNSEDGWGLGEKTEGSDANQYYANVTESMHQLSKENDKLKNEIGISNTKLAKALKKLKELKLNNDRLTNELKTANQMSEFNLLDTTIENEFKNQVKDLEEKMVEKSAELLKERREKDALVKQNDLLNNANDRFLEMKEKLENEVVAWKYKFKEAADKMSSFDWGEHHEAQSKDSLPIKQFEDRERKSTDSSLLEQIEKENDDLNSLVDQLRKQNSEQSILQSKQKDEIFGLKNELSIIKSNTEKQLREYDEEKVMLKSIISNLESNLTTKVANDDFRCEKCDVREKSLNDLVHDLEVLRSENNNLKSTLEKINNNIKCITIECNNHKEMNISLNNEVQILQANLDAANEKLQHLPSTPEDEHINATERCKFLEEHCNTLKMDLDNALTQISNLQSELSVSGEKIIELEIKAEDLENKSTKLNEENDQLLSTVTELRASISSAVDQRGYEVAEMWKQHLTQRETDFGNIEHELHEQISVLENKYEKLLDNVQSSSQEETSKMIIMEQLSSLQTKLKDKEDHLISLQEKYSDLVSEMQILRAEIEDEKLIYENKQLIQQEESEKQLVELHDHYHQDIIQKDSTINELSIELNKMRESNQTSLLKLEEYTHTTETLQNSISDLVNQIRLKDSEIYRNTQEYNIILNQRNDEFENLRQRLMEYESKIEELTFEKESELAVLRLKVHEQSTAFKNSQSKLEAENVELGKQLTEKIEECIMLNKKIHELNKSLEEDASKMIEVRTVLETQEMEIVTLKDEMEHMQILLESSAAKVAKHVTFASGTKSGDNNEAEEKETADAGVLDMVPRAELDLALYMLHQRDMRCEELTMELTSLLEERDTLQLRLSDCLRSYEEMRRRCESAGVEIAVEAHASSGYEQSTVETATHSTSRGSVSETENLQTKLSELRSVRQMRDVRLRQDSERRDLDMQLLQRDVARLPPAAADQLRQAHYTLTRDSQSASTVLLNWLRGKSTPKVVHM